MEDIKNETSAQKPEVNENVIDQIELYKEQAKKATSMLAYLSADFDNYKKRIEKERALWTDQAAEEVLLNILPVLDDIDRGRGEVRTEINPDMHVTGLELIARGFEKILARYNIEEIPYTPVFDTHFFEAIMQIPSDSHASGEVVAILRKGYTRKGKVLRPAEVSVAQ
ncbi:nucleotide exchange factor GrpE [Candidatus Dependentiae bacterium]|nr:nucleotide exchange factor GrpE [Candidatus Dependentiae bacterium]